MQIAGAIKRSGNVSVTMCTTRLVARAKPSSSYGNRKPITLSTKPLSTFAPIDDEIDDEDLVEAVPA